MGKVLMHAAMRSRRHVNQTWSDRSSKSWTTVALAWLWEILSNISSLLCFVSYARLKKSEGCRRPAIPKSPGTWRLGWADVWEHAVWAHWLKARLDPVNQFNKYRMSAQMLWDQNFCVVNRLQEQEDVTFVKIHYKLHCHYYIGSMNSSSSIVDVPVQVLAQKCGWSLKHRDRPIFTEAQSLAL